MFTILVLVILILPFESALASNNKTIIPNKLDTQTSIINNDVEAIINQINKSLISYYLEELVKFGPRFTGTENCSKAAEYIYNEFEKLNLDVNYHHYTFLLRTGSLWERERRIVKEKNVVGTLHGVGLESDAVIILCAHYDTTKTSPGANDDGSGVAAMLAIAHVCSQYSFNHTIKFIAFSGEEVGTCGSHAYAKEAYANRENIHAVFNLETFGNTSQGGKELFILKTARTEWISQFSQEIAEKYYELCNLKMVSIGNRPCDHQSFLEYGYDAVQFVQLNRGDYPLHSPEDSIEKINYTYLVNVTKLICAISVEIANTPIYIQLRIVTPYEGYFYIKDTAVLCLPGFNIPYTGLRGMTYILGSAVIRVNITTDLDIKSVFFCVDGVSEFYAECTQPPYEWEIQQTTWLHYPLIGKHVIGAYVWTEDGKVAYDEMDIFILSF